MGTRLYVGNLSFNTTDDALRAAFAQDGRVVTDVKIMVDRDTGRSRGFAFVEMSDTESAQRAIKELDRYSYGGRNLTVNEAKPREDRGGGGGGGRGGYGGGGRRY